MRTVIIGCLTLLVGIAIAPPRSEACLLTYCQNPSGGDGKTSPATACGIYYGDRNHSAGYDTVGRVCNYDEDDAVVVTCPLVRDKWGSTSGIQCVAAYLVRDDDAPTGCGLSNYSKWECIAQSKDETGLYGWWEGWSSMAAEGYETFAQGTGYAKGYWQAKVSSGYNVDDSNAFYMGTYFLSCKLPPVLNCGGANCLSGFRWVE